jgi:hypothetical protein
MFQGIVGLLILVAEIWAIINVISSRESGGAKVLWIIFILLVPLIGVIVWFFVGPRGKW